MQILLLSTLTIGILHALAPDHWLPFVALARAQGWSRLKLTWIILLAGVGHIVSGLLVAGIGVALGWANEQLGSLEEIRANIASMLLIAFGIVYMLWGLKTYRRPHTHATQRAHTITYWTIFALVVFGPCEPLIPLIFAGAAYGWMRVLLIVALFGVATITMMLLQVHLAMSGLSLWRSHKFEHASSIIAGAIIFLTGVAIRIFGI